MGGHKTNYAEEQVLYLLEALIVFAREEHLSCAGLTTAVLNIPVLGKTNEMAAGGSSGKSFSL